ncbi:hypothetical protein G9A89_009179 [Geosiphon pyriformis]|nr:hypothetical protein G9A89_009179 [Geosiphon pyriformis]
MESQTEDLFSSRASSESHPSVASALETSLSSQVSVKSRPSRALQHKNSSDVSTSIDLNSSTASWEGVSDRTTSISQNGNRHPTPRANLSHQRRRAQQKERRSKRVPFEIEDEEPVISTPTTEMKTDQEQTTEEGESSLEDEDILTGKIVMAVSYRHRKLGCAYYNVTNSTLYLMEDAYEAPPYDILHLLRFQIMPSAILTSSRADEEFIQALKVADEPGTVETMVEIRPSAEFVWGSAKTKLLSIKCAQAYENSPSQIEATRKEMYLKLSSIVDMESVETVGCAGSLITYLSKARTTGDLPEGQGLEVLSVEQFSVKSFLHVNADALCSLQIFEDETHPNMHMRSRAKEGLSVFGILDNTRTTFGKILYKQWFLRPTLDLETLNERYLTIECLIQPENLQVSDQLAACLKHLKNVPKILANMKMTLNMTEWQSLLKFAFFGLKIRNLARELNQSEEIRIFRKIREILVVSDLKDIGSCINDVIDFDESATESRCVVKPHVDEASRTYNGLDSFLVKVFFFKAKDQILYLNSLIIQSEVAREIATMIPTEFASTLNVIYFPQLGYLITVPLKLEWKEEDDFKIEGFYYQFSTETTVYYKNDRMRELCVDVFVTNDTYIVGGKGVNKDEDLEDAPTSEMDEETDNSTSGGRDINYSDEKSVMLLSGANYSGKSVYLKQIAVIVFMAHIGSFVPAETAIIGLTDKILTRVQTRETISRIQSAFMIDLQQISMALRSCTSRSLLIFDEFGKGTGSTDGAGLFCGVIEHLLKRGRECPKVIAATHFHEIFENDLLSPSLPITLGTMEIIRDDNDGELTFLYRSAIKLVPGRSTSSWGSFCATMAGVPAHVVQRANYLSSLFAKYESIPPPFADERERRTYAICEQVSRRFVELNFGNENEMMEEDSDIDTEIESFFDWVGREANL